ncbi:Hypothetical Uncharacterized protein (fragment) [Clostridium chauvoei JF4335]
MDVSWSRTPEIPDNQIVTETREDKKPDSNHWSSDGNTYILNNPGETEKGRVLRTPYSIADNNITYNLIFDYEAMTQYLNPTETTRVWDGKNNPYFSKYVGILPSNYPECATWKRIDGHEWRMFRGNFNLNGDINNKEVYLGVLSGSSPELILPVNDFLMVFINGKPTNINYGTQNSNGNSMKFRMPDGSIETLSYKQAVSNHNNRCYNKNHLDMSKHTDGWHVHLNEGATNENGHLNLGDISKYLDPSKTEQTIEIFTGDIAEGGGTSKFEVFVVDKPDVEVSKGAYLLENGIEETLVENSQVYASQEINYTFKLQNTGDQPLTNIVFEDNLLGIKVTKDGVYKLNSEEKIESSVGNVVTKTLSDGSLKQGGLELLENLQLGEAVEVKGLNSQKYVVSDVDINMGQVLNTVVGKGNYFNDKLTISKEATFNLEAIDIPLEALNFTMQKHVEEIKRGNEIIYKRGETQEESTTKIVQPGDEVKFLFDISNETKIKERAMSVNNLSLEDFLENEWKDSTPNWVYKLVNNDGSLSDFNANNFSMNINEKIKVLVEGFIVPEPKVGWNYKITNTVTLKRSGHDMATSSANIEIAKPSINIVKALEGIFKVEDLGSKFTIVVTGSDGKTYTLDVNQNEPVTISNLLYGVEYTINEVVPMNYELKGIEITDKAGNIINNGTDNKLKFTLNKDLNGKTVKVTNSKENNSLFFDYDKIKNVFKWNLEKFEIFKKDE